MPTGSYNSGCATRRCDRLGRRVWSFAARGLPRLPNACFNNQSCLSFPVMPLYSPHINVCNMPQALYAYMKTFIESSCFEGLLANFIKPPVTGTLKHVHILLRCQPQPRWRRCQESGKQFSAAVPTTGGKP